MYGRDRDRQKNYSLQKVKGNNPGSSLGLTGLNVRTIQRIESGEVDPRLYTLKSIAEALSVCLEELLPEPTQHELNQLAVLRIAPAAFFLFPVLGNVLLPFIFWMMKREEINGINKHGKDILNSQLTHSIVISIIIAAVMAMALIQIFFPWKSILPFVFYAFPYLHGGGNVFFGHCFWNFAWDKCIKSIQWKEAMEVPL